MDEGIDRRQFQAFFRQVRSWGRWGPLSPRGALNHLTPDRIAAAGRLARSGTAISLGLPLTTRASIATPVPAHHRMTMLPDADGASGGLHLAKDHVGLDCHSEGHSHIDAFSHVAYDGALDDGQPASAVTSDVPGVRGLRRLEPGEQVVTDDLEAAERRQGVRVGAGDILLIRTGHALRMAELGPGTPGRRRRGSTPAWRPSSPSGRPPRSGPTATTTPLPARPRGSRSLLPRCQEAGRWEFLFVAAPLRIEGGTGSPVNPIAVL